MRADRDGGGHVPVERLADLHRSAPDLLAGLRVQTLQLIVVELAQEGAVAHRAGHARSPIR